MGSVLNAGVMAAQNNVLNMQHLLSGDIKLTDGGWAEVCGSDTCHSHASPAEPHVGDIDMHHHHHASEAPTSPLPRSSDIPASSLMAVVSLRPGAVSALTGHLPTMPDQPPRV